MATRLLDDTALQAWPLPLPHGEGDKETRGRVVVVAGSCEMPGAAILAARSALRAGAGKVVVATTRSTAVAVAVAVPEARVVALAETAAGGIDPASADVLAELAAPDNGGACALLVGPGMQDAAACHALASALLTRLPGVPTVLDAAAMDAAATRPAGGPLVAITPHAGEMAHLSGRSKDDVLADAHAAACEAARRWNAVVAMKGACTVIALPDGSAWRHEEGNVGLATAGSGDVLAGLVAGLAARGAPLEQAVAWGVALHARAGVRLARRIGVLGYFASELAREVPAIMEGLCGAPEGASRTTPDVGKRFS